MKMTNCNILLDLYTKSILKPRSSRDGRRISVMSRHTLEDGVTQDKRITEKSSLIATVLGIDTMLMN